MEYMSTASMQEIERRSILTGYVMRATSQPDTALLAPDVAARFDIDWPNVQSTIDAAIRNPRLYASNERKNLAAHQSLLSIAAAHHLQTSPTDQDGQRIFAFDRSNALDTVRPAERLRDPSRTIYAPMARILRSAGVHFDPKRYDTDLANEAAAACTEEPTNLEGHMRTIQRVWKRSGVVMGTYADAATGSITRQEVHTFDNFQPSSDGKVVRHAQLVADLQRLVLAFR
jgi:hypothetical protein